MAAGLQHLQLYTYESLVSNIQRTINVTVTQRDLAQPTGHTVELLYLKFIHVIYALDIEDYLLDLYNQSEPVNIVAHKQPRVTNISSQAIRRWLRPADSATLSQEYHAINIRNLLD
jgi:Nuf2 family